MGAIGSLGSFLIGGLIFAVQIWPIPQLRAKPTPEGAAQSSRFSSTALALFLLIGFLFSGVSIWGAWSKPSEPPKITTENIESIIKQWAESFHYGYRRDDDPKSYFKYVISLPDGSPIVVRRLKDYDQYLSIEAALKMSTNSQALIDRLPRKKQEEIAMAIRIEMLRYKVGYQDINVPLQTMALSISLPINSALTEFDFVRTLNELHSARLLTREIVRSRIEFDR